MTDKLDLHAASPDEVAAAHRNVFDIWGRGLSLEDHVRFRLESPKHRTATWYVGCVDGRVVVSLGAYPLLFRIRGEIVPGIAIGSVYTVEGFRRRGLAARLIAWVEEQTRRDGAVLSLLYSDIDPEYYARLGYQACPSFEGWRDPRAWSWPVAETHKLVEFDGPSHLNTLLRLYSSYHAAKPLSIARDMNYWQGLLQRFPDDQFFALSDPSDNWDGYVRLNRQDTTLRITDYALAKDRAALSEQLYATTISLARELGAEKCGGWMRVSPATRSFFQFAPRTAEITMIKSLSRGHPLDGDLLVSTDRFCEIDHV